MPSDKNKLPGVLLLVLSALGILICWLAAAAVAFGLANLRNSPAADAEILTGASAGALAFFAGLLQLPALVLAIQSLRGKSTAVKQPSLYKIASFLGLAWLLIMAAGVFASRSHTAKLILVPLTMLAVAIPVWWLVEFSRRGLKRSTGLREWGTLAIGLTAAPLMIMTFEVVAVILVVLAVLIILDGQPGFFEQLTQIAQNMELYQGSLEQLEGLILELARNPVIAAGLFLMIGVIAPMIEELFKPMVIWFLLNRPLKDHEGFSLGLISGGAFALLESAGIVSQVGVENWAQVVSLRAATGLLHVGLSGLVGYGLVSSWNKKRFGRALFFVFGAGGLHGAWNALALISGFSTSVPSAGTAEIQPTPAMILSVFGMAVVFVAVIYTVLWINKSLRTHAQNTPQQESALPAPPAAS